jgi:hypothetical protein
MRYVLHDKAGTSARRFPNSPHPRDCDARGVLPRRRTPSGGGMRLADFAACPEAKQAGLSLLQVAALRIYTTAAFRSINDPLRDLRRKASGQPHPLPLTCVLIDRAVGKLRTVGAHGVGANESLDLWRGLKGVTVEGDFTSKGGTELATMSTTNDLLVALSYMQSAQGSGLLLRVRTDSSMERGADLAFLSAFPAEAEYLYKPLTYLQPLGEAKEITLAGRAVTVIDVAPRS